MYPLGNICQIQYLNAGYGHHYSEFKRDHLDHG